MGIHPTLSTGPTGTQGKKVWIELPHQDRDWLEIRPVTGILYQTVLFDGFVRFTLIDPVYKSESLKLIPLTPPSVNQPKPFLIFDFSWCSPPEHRRSFYLFHPFICLKYSFVFDFISTVPSFFSHSTEDLDHPPYLR